MARYPVFYTIIEQNATSGLLDQENIPTQEQTALYTEAEQYFAIRLEAILFESSFKHVQTAMQRLGLRLVANMLFDL